MQELEFLLSSHLNYLMAARGGDYSEYMPELL